MGHTLEAFAASCHDILKGQPGAPGRERVCALLRDVLQDSSFVAAHLGDDVPERKILYEDAELGFCILAHVHHDAKESPPHDHGPSWAIYGQAAGETEMTDWELVEAAVKQFPARSEERRRIRLRRVWLSFTTRATCTRRAAKGPPGSSAWRGSIWIMCGA